MCGISGIFHQQYHDSHLECVQTMVQYMKHRGPDAQNTLVVSKQPEVIFGHDRFSIFDLSPQAAQPMKDAENGNVIVFNGDIYNFKTLRKELQSQGHPFKTQSDTEVRHLQFQDASQRASVPRTSVQNTVGHGSPAESVCPVGRRLPPPPARLLRVRPVGRRKATPPARPRPRRSQTALHLSKRRRNPLRLRIPRPAGLRRAARTRHGRRPFIP